jgi:hypothetical protein
MPPAPAYALGGTGLGSSPERTGIADRRRKETTASHTDNQLRRPSSPAQSLRIRNILCCTKRQHMARKCQGRGSIEVTRMTSEGGNGTTADYVFSLYNPMIEMGSLNERQFCARTGLVGQ